MLQRGTSQQAGLIAHLIIATHDDVPVTAHQVAEVTPHHLRPERVASLLTQRNTAVENRRTAHAEWQTAVDDWDIAMAPGKARIADRESQS